MDGCSDSLEQCPATCGSSLGLGGGCEIYILTYIYTYIYTRVTCFSGEAANRGVREERLERGERR